MTLALRPLLLILALLGWAGPALAQARTPLLIEGKTTLYQSVLTRPGVKIAEGVGAPGTVPVQPFTPLYVYERMPVDGGGPTSGGRCRCEGSGAGLPQGG